MAEIFITVPMYGKIVAIVKETSEYYERLFSRLGVYITNLNIEPGGEFVAEDAKAEMNEFAERLVAEKAEPVYVEGFY